MTDFLFGQLRPNWTSNTGFEAVSSNMEFITIQTLIDIRTYSQNIALGASAVVATASQQNLNKLLEIVSLRGQPVVMGTVSAASPFIVLLATEHAGGWQNVNTTASGATGINAPNSLISRIVADGVNYGFGQNLSAVTATTAAATSTATVIVTAALAGVMAGDGFTASGGIAGTVVEILSPTSFLANVAQTIGSSVVITFTPSAGGLVNDTPGAGALQVTFTNVMT
jgi:hypothetical protein